MDVPTSANAKVGFPAEGMAGVNRCSIFPFTLFGMLASDCSTSSFTFYVF